MKSSSRPTGNGNIKITLRKMCKKFGVCKRLLKEVYLMVTKAALN